MKIACIHLNLATESGDPRMFFSLAQALKRAGHEVKIFTAQFDSACFPNLHRGLDIVVAEARRKLDAVFEEKGILRKILNRLERERRYKSAARAVFKLFPRDLEALILQNDQSYELGRLYKKINPAARTIWIMNNAPWRHTHKSNFLVNILSILAAWWKKLSVKIKHIKGIDLIVVHDEEQRRLLRGIKAEAATLYIPINFENFYAPPRPMRSVKQIILLGIGALSPARKFEDIIAAAGILRKRGRDAGVILVCKDFWKDAVYKDLLLRAAKESGMEKHVKFYFEGASEAELREILRRSHFYVFPNHIKIWSMSSFEAMAAGLPLVVSDATSVAEVLQDGENALFVRPGCPEEIAEQIEKLISDPVLYAKIAENGQKFVKENLNWGKYASNLLRLIS